MRAVLGHPWRHLLQVHQPAACRPPLPLTSAVILRSVGPATHTIFHDVGGLCNGSQCKTHTSPTHVSHAITSHFARSGLKKPIFTAGNDLGELFAPGTSRDRYKRFWAESQEFLCRLYSSPLLTISAIRGACAPALPLRPALDSAGTPIRLGPARSTSCPRASSPPSGRRPHAMHQHAGRAHTGRQRLLCSHITKVIVCLSWVFQACPVAAGAQRAAAPSPSAATTALCRTPAASASTRSSSAFPCPSSGRRSWRASWARAAQTSSAALRKCRRRSRRSPWAWWTRSWPQGTSSRCALCTKRAQTCVPVHASVAVVHPERRVALALGHRACRVTL